MLRRPLFFTLCALAVVSRAAPDASPAPSAEQSDLQTVDLIEAAVVTRSAAGADERDAVAQLEKAYAALEAKYPASASVRDEHGSFLWWQHREGDAFAKWREAEQLDASNPNVCQHLGSSLLESGDIPQGIGYLERAAALAPRDAMQHFTLGTDLYLFRHQMTTARDPESAVVARALAELKHASDLEPLNASYAQGYAETFYSVPVADWPGAIKAWQHLYDISGKKDFAAINLARVSLLMQDGTAARGYLEKVTTPAFQPLKKKLLAKANGMQPAHAEAIPTDSPESR
jgi:tetratricopeptide (TPR) repeat protein